MDDRAKLSYFQPQSSHQAKRCHSSYTSSDNQMAFLGSDQLETWVLGSIWTLILGIRVFWILIEENAIKIEN